MTLLSRIETATADQQADLLREAFTTVFGEEPPSEYKPRAWKTGEPDFSPAWVAYINRRNRFRNFLDCGAYESAAISMLPEGADCTVSWCHGKAEAVAFIDAITGDAATPALALIAAILKAKEQQHV